MRLLHSIIIALLPLAESFVREDRAVSRNNEWYADCRYLRPECVSKQYERLGNNTAAKYLLKKLKEAEFQLENKKWRNDEKIACYRPGSGPEGFCLFFVLLPYVSVSYPIDNVIRALEAIQYVQTQVDCCGQCGRGWRFDWDMPSLKLDYVKNACKDICY
ncbi:hypothetical protein ACCO45_004635 [Purpureocillium lilacinum]|uniref:Uncharacterized protein n=1 Tax=Purpureocillium lilacinum TaxID=33203 RepID=A0ACC4DTS7_PURLI